MNDPGWGSYVDPADGKNGGSGGKGKGGGGKNPLERFGRTPLLIAAGVLVLVVVGVGYTLFHKSGKSAAQTTTSHTVTPANVTVTVDTTTPVDTSGGLLSKADFITQADAICTQYKPQIAAAESAGSVEQLVPVVQSELAALKALGEPAQDASIVDRSLDDEEEAISLLQQGNTDLANQDILEGDTLAGTFGMTVCNYGH